MSDFCVSLLPRHTHLAWARDLHSESDGACVKNAMISAEQCHYNPSSSSRRMQSLMTSSASSAADKSDQNVEQGRAALRNARAAQRLAVWVDTALATAVHDPLPAHGQPAIQDRNALFDTQNRAGVRGIFNGNGGGSHRDDGNAKVRGLARVGGAERGCGC
jgi:hypothetical protein